MYVPVVPTAWGPVGATGPHCHDGNEHACHDRGGGVAAFPEGDEETSSALCCCWCYRKF